MRAKICKLRRAVKYAVARVRLIQPQESSRVFEVVWFDRTEADLSWTRRVGNRGVLADRAAFLDLRYARFILLDQASVQLGYRQAWLGSPCGRCDR
jgi:hypothetical protein